MATSLLCPQNPRIGVLLLVSSSLEITRSQMKRDETVVREYPEAFLLALYADSLS